MMNSIEVSRNRYATVEQSEKGIASYSSQKAAIVDMASAISETSRLLRMQPPH